MSSPYIYVNQSLLLNELTDEILHAPRLAIDTEADSLHHYYEKICLIQVSLIDRDFILDPLAGLDLSAFLEALSSRTLILHGSDYDLRMLYSSFGYRHKGLMFDTMLAAQILGYEQLGLAALVKRHFNVDLVKKGQKADWSQRPLSRELLDYASDDTRYLLQLADLMGEELQTAGRVKWHRQACLNQLKAAEEVNERDPDTLWRIKGSSKFSGLGLALMKEIWQWRETEAQCADRPSFKILGNQSILDLVEWAIDHPHADLSNGPRLPRDCMGKRYKALQAAIRSAHSLSRASWPSTQPALKPNLTRRVDEALVNALRAIRDKAAQEMDIDPAVLAPKSALYAIARTLPVTQEDLRACARLTQWQADRLSPSFLNLLGKFPGCDKKPAPESADPSVQGIRISE